MRLFTPVASSFMTRSSTGLPGCGTALSHEAVKDLAFTRPNHFSGSGTVGSTEACLLAGLAHKFRWRRWYADRHKMTAEQVLGVRPNLVMSSVFQAAWEKFFRYFDVEPRFRQAQYQELPGYPRRFL